MKRLLTGILLLLAFTVTAMAGVPEHKFDPERYKRDLECAITREAKLTPQEAQAFFPLFHEMLEKERKLYMQRKNLKCLRDCNEKEAQEAVKKLLQLDKDMTQLHQSYSVRFLKIISATKFLIVLTTQEHFNHDLMKGKMKPKK